MVSCPIKLTPKQGYSIPVHWWYCTMGFQLKRTHCSKTFATRPKLGNMVYQMENQTTQGDHVLLVHSRQKNITQSKTVWRDTKSLSSSEISRNYFRLSTHFPKTLWGHPGPLQHQVPPIKVTSQSSKMRTPSPCTIIQIYKQCVRPIFEYGSLSTITTSDNIIRKI